MNHNARRVLENIRASNDKQWIAALAAKRVNGTETAMLAEELACSHDKIRYLSLAGQAYTSLMGYETFRKGLHDCRKGLTLSHFSRLGELWKKYEFDPEDAYDYLKIAYYDRIPVRTFAEHIENIHKPVPQYFFLKFALTSYNANKRAITSFDVPEGIREAAKNFNEKLDLWREENE